jgi:glycerol-3-phosphate dehydrogenase
MAEECVDQAAMLARLEERACTTHQLNIHGFHENAEKFGHLAFYGADAPAIEDLVRAKPSLGASLHADLPVRGAEVVWAAREEMARTVDDILARRTRALFLDANAAIAMAPETARILAAELGCDDAWAREQVKAFTAIAEGYRV